MILRVLACLGFARVVFVLRRIRRVFRAMDLLSHVFSLGWVSFGVFGQEHKEWNGTKVLLLIVDNYFMGLGASGMDYLNYTP